MGAFTMPYILPLFLGMTFDARTSRPGVDIYESKYVDDPGEAEHYLTKSTYRITSEMSEVLKALDIEGDLAFKIKSGMVNVEGKGSYIKNAKDYKNTVEILTHMQYTSKTLFLNEGAKPKKAWAQLYNTGVLGTHYVTEVTYGAEMIASARFVLFNNTDKTFVQGEVNAAFGTNGTAVDLTAEGKLEQLQEKVGGKANLEISYYGTVPLRSIPNTIDGLRTLIGSFKDQVEETDMKAGIPMTVRLSPLADIATDEDKGRFEYIKNENLQNSMTDFEQQMDEMRQVRNDLKDWTNILPYELDREVEKEIGFLLKNISLTLEVYYQVVWDLDLTKGPEQFKPAFDAYDYDGSGTYNRFSKLLRKLKARLMTVKANQFAFKLAVKRDTVTSDTYFQFGNNKCTANKTVTLYEGFVISSLEEGTGGPTVYDCLPRSAKKGYLLTEETNRRSHLAGFRYTKLDKELNPFKGPNAKKIEEQGISCAKCYSPDSYAVAMIPATDKCPASWEVMYKGYLMSARKAKGVRTKYVCVDEEPSEAYTMDDEHKARYVMALTTVHTMGSLPKEVYPEGALIRCVLCSMKSNQVVF
ncbi:hypothetical protein JTE90_002380 [Oedothorax gibbosus]|uniref:Uncharacterized protein n=1 Tax=Oedothorax gibbosus TaxID=931172 RepID=A0AAV6VBN6_9ARAC|nr:hypothetical protein JTE90_002380 [Oedothorax gibbosus]